MMHVGDTGRFIDAAEDQGYLWYGTVTAIDEHDRLTVTDKYDNTSVTIKADLVRFVPDQPQDVGPQYWPPRS